jgi:hypothetical protein
MTKLRIAEVFGHAVENNSLPAKKGRKQKFCPFRGTRCTKASKRDPIGICSLSNGENATALCPVRFLEDNRVFVDAGRIAFGTGVPFAPVPEVKILRVGKRKIGKVDFLLAKLDSENNPVDFAALEVQAVYFSGRSIRPAMNFFLKNNRLEAETSSRRPDYRSCAQKRLMPQLRLKVPVFRRWGKSFFVAVDSLFFEELPSFRTVSPSNSEITWLSYPIVLQGGEYKLGDPIVYYTLWDDILDALREGSAPEQSEIVEELRRRLHKDNYMQT